jgi:hypothetical protein
MLFGPVTLNMSFPGTNLPALTLSDIPTIHLYTHIFFAWCIHFNISTLISSLAWYTLNLTITLRHPTASYGAPHPERDPRKKLVLEEPRPNILFGLCQACVSTPTLVVLKDAETVNEELKQCARRFFHEFVKLDPANKTIWLPFVMRVYWADFGGNRAKVLRTMAQLSGSQFSAEIKPYFSPLEGMKAKVDWLKLDWTPQIAIENS